MPLTNYGDIEHARPGDVVDFDDTRCVRRGVVAGRTANNSARIDVVADGAVYEVHWLTARKVGTTAMLGRPGVGST